MKTGAPLLGTLFVPRPPPGPDPWPQMTISSVIYSSSAPCQRAKKLYRRSGTAVPAEVLFFQQNDVKQVM